jgi:hypothetical protein
MISPSFVSEMALRPVNWRFLPESFVYEFLMPPSVGGTPLQNSPPLYRFLARDFGVLKLSSGTVGSQIFAA